MRVRRCMGGEGGLGGEREREGEMLVHMRVESDALLLLDSFCLLRAQYVSLPALQP